MTAGTSALQPFQREYTVSIQLFSTVFKKLPRLENAEKFDAKKIEIMEM
jgi:hypothetical protein